MGNKRITDLTPEEAEARRARDREYRKRYRATEAGRAILLEVSKKYRVKNLDNQRGKDRDRAKKKYWQDPDKARAECRVKHEKRPDIGQRSSRRRRMRLASYRTASAIMLDIRKRAPHLECRDEIISVAALLVCEGIRLGDAVRRAIKIAVRDQDFTKYSSVPVDDCFWLCEEHEEVEVEPDPESDWLTAAYREGPPTHPLYFRA